MEEPAVLERVLRTISRYNMLPTGARVAVAVSGGADSVCLLHVLRELAPRFGLTLSIAHFNHKLRGAASDEDEAFVGRMAAGMGIIFRRADTDLSTTRDNLEQAARRARRSFLAGLIREGCVDRVALGHTRDDQAETVLFRLMRGSGLAGLAGIYPSAAEGFIRPLIDATRADVEQYLRAHRIQWRDDATNLDRRFARNRIRHDLLPQLRRDWNPQLADALAHLADLAQEEERWWLTEVDRLARDSIFERDDGVEIPAAALAGLPRAAARRLVRRAIGAVKGDLRRVEFEHVEGILDLAARRTGAGRMRLPALAVTRSHDWIRVAIPGSPPTPEPILATIPGTYALPGGGPGIHLEVVEKRGTGACARLKAELSWRGIASPLELRGWKPGDHYRPVGQSRDQKVKEMFQQSRVPSWRRRFWPILTGGDKILWAQEFGVAAEFAAGEDSGPLLRICEAENAER